MRFFKEFYLPFQEKLVLYLTKCDRLAKLNSVSGKTERRNGAPSKERKFRI